MIIGLLKLIFEKVIGIDKIDPSKREKFWKNLKKYSLKLASEMAEGTARGIKNG